MRIGIDARFLTHPQPGGFKTYSQNLVQALAGAGGDHRYILYVDRGHARAASWAESVVVPRGLPIFGMALREQIGVPLRSARDRVDVLHAPCNTAPLLTRTPMVLTLHDTIQVVEPQVDSRASGRARLKQGAIASYSRAVIRGAVRAARRIITVSEYEKTRIVEDLGADPQRVRVVHLAPDSAFVRAPDATRAGWRREAHERLSLPDRFVLGVGYEPRKNIPLLIDAFARYCATLDPDLGLVIVAAQSESADAFMRQAEKQGIAARTRVLGRQTTDAMARLYNLAEVFAFPSIRESFGLPPLEALACGTPVITMRASSLPEVVGDAAVLVQPGAEDVFGAALAAVLSDPTRRHEMAVRGPARARQFSWHETARQTVAVYEEAVA